MIITEPKWKSLIVETIGPIFTPEQCQLIINAGRSEPVQDGQVGGGNAGVAGSNSTGCAGTVNTGSGGGSGSFQTNNGTGGNGGSGIVVVLAPNAKVSAPGVWSLNDAYNYRKAGTWN